MNRHDSVWMDWQHWVTMAGLARMSVLRLDQGTGDRSGRRCRGSFPRPRRSGDNLLRPVVEPVLAEPVGSLRADERLRLAPCFWRQAEQRHGVELVYS